MSIIGEIQDRPVRWCAVPCLSGEAEGVMNYTLRGMACIKTSFRCKAWGGIGDVLSGVDT